MRSGGQVLPAWPSRFEPTEHDIPPGTRLPGNGLTPRLRSMVPIHERSASAEVMEVFVGTNVRRGLPALLLSAWPCSFLHRLLRPGWMALL